MEAKVWYAGLIAGFGIIVPMAFVFLPVSRGSVLLRLANIPFEHAVKYHKWGAFIMMLFTILHGVLIFVWWAMTSRLSHDVILDRSHCDQLVSNCYELIELDKLLKAQLET